MFHSKNQSTITRLALGLLAGVGLACLPARGHTAQTKGAAPAVSSATDRSDSKNKMGDAPAADQSTVALKQPFASVAATDSTVTSALAPGDAAKAEKLVGKKAALVGTVTKVYSPGDHGIVFLDFDKDYHNDIAVVAQPPDYAKLPDLKQLEGKKVLISGPVIDYKGRPEFKLTAAEQIKLVNK